MQPTDQMSTGIEYSESGVKGTEEDLGGAVPEGDHVLSVLAVGNGVVPGESEVCDFDLVVGVDEDVVGLHVPVEDAVVVELLDSAEDLVHDDFDLEGREEDFFVQTAEQLSQVEVDELEHQKNGLFVQKALEKSDDVGVVDLLQNGNLSHGDDGDSFVGVLKVRPRTSCKSPLQ